MVLGIFIFDFRSVSLFFIGCLWASVGAVYSSVTCIVDPWPSVRDAVNSFQSIPGEFTDRLCGWILYVLEHAMYLVFDPLILCLAYGLLSSPLIYFQSPTSVFHQFYRKKICFYYSFYICKTFSVFLFTAHINIYRILLVDVTQNCIIRGICLHSSTSENRL